MKTLKLIAALGIGLGLAACGSIDTVSRNAPFEQVPTLLAAPVAQDALTAAAAPRAGVPADATEISAGPVAVNSILVHVPRQLRVSEANTRLPGGDIVWRGDAPGDRHAQVQAIFETALSRGVASLNGAQTVDLEIEVKRFHALTEKTRYTTGGVHNITFLLAIKDPQTGALIAPIREVRADLEGFGGQKALDAERAGQTQKVRITDHLARVIRDELTQPGGHRNARLGLLQALNNAI